MAENQDVTKAAASVASGQTISPVIPKDTSGNVTGAAWGPVPLMESGMTFREVGQSGLRAFSGWVREEFLQQLIGRQGAQKYREMRDNSPIIGGILFAISATMRKVEWRDVPANDSPEAQEAAEFVSGCREDMSHTWEDLVSENLSMLPFGFAPHEIVYKKRLGRTPGKDPDRQSEDLPQSRFDDKKIGWRRIPLRSQDTILKWFFDENGSIKGVTQQPWIGPIVDIPIEKLLLFRSNPYKNNPEGISILRNSYVPYYYMKRMQEQEAILAERMGGIPVIRVPLVLLEAANNGDAQAGAALQTYKKIATNIRIDEQMGVVLPSDPFMGMNGPSQVRQYEFELVTPGHGGSSRGGGAMDFDKIISRYTIQMMTSMLADFLQLGHEARGTQSLAVSKVDMFFQAIEGFLNMNAAVYNRYAVPRLWELNGMDEEVMPKIEPDLAQRVDLDVLSNFVLRLAQSGMPMFPNEELQTFLLDAAGMPDVTDDRALQAAGLDDPQLELDRQQQEEALAQQQLRTEAMANPEAASPTAGMNNLHKIIAASVARRLIRHAGPRFGIVTKSRGKANGRYRGL